MRLQGKVALVSGAAAGIGAAIATALAAEGASVMVTDIDAAAAAALAESIRATGGSADSVKLDAADEAQWMAAVAATVERWGSMSVLVNNAGIAPTADPIENLALTDWRRSLSVNLDGVFLGVKHGIRAMKSNTSTAGSIINVSSILGIVGTTRASDYVAAKGAVRLLTKAAALECCQMGYPIRVNSVHPGFIETPMLERGLQNMERLGRAAHRLERYRVDIGIACLGRLKFMRLLQCAKGVLIALGADHRQPKRMLRRSGQRLHRDRLAQKRF